MRMKNSVTILKVIVRKINGTVNWHKIYSQCEGRHEEIRLKIWNMVQESFLKEDDVASLLKDCKHENKLCLTLEATKLINKLRTETGWRLRVMNGLTNTISTGYWFARGRASIEMEGEAHDLFRDWRSGTWSNPRLARLGRR